MFLIRVQVKERPASVKKIVPRIEQGRQSYPQAGNLRSAKNMARLRSMSMPSKRIQLRAVFVDSSEDLAHFTATDARQRTDSECTAAYQRGMLPCFFLGLVSHLFSRARREVMTRRRV